MILFRTISKKFAAQWHQWDKTESFRKGARWNSAQTPVMYFSSNPQNAMLETSNYYATPRLANAVAVLCVFECKSLAIRSIEPHELPSDWDSPLHQVSTQALGDTILQGADYDGILVPSVGIHPEVAAHPLNDVRQTSYANVVINPLSARVKNMELIEILSPVFTQRMFA
jgi:RES domain-containing protein